MYTIRTTKQAVLDTETERDRQRRRRGEKRENVYTIREKERETRAHTHTHCGRNIITIPDHPDCVITPIELTN